jgi:hypothetical protein
MEKGATMNSELMHKEVSGGGHWLGDRRVK